MDYIAEALQKYNMVNEQTQLIRHNENMTIKVGENYLLRIHKSVEGFSAGYMYEALDQKKIRCEEMKFLSYLHANGIPVQSPVKNTDGAEVTVLSDGTLATMLTWVPGCDLQNETLTNETCFAIGEMVAKLHQVAKDYVAETIPGYNAGLCDSLKKMVCLTWKNYNPKDTSALKHEYFECMIKACETIADHFKEKEGDFFPVHTDLSLSNILITEQGLVPIDFSLFGLGHPMMDLGALFCSRLNSLENRQAAAKGYRFAGGSIDFEILDCCFALNVLLGIGLHINKWISEDWFPSRLERWCRELFEPLSKGKKLFSDDFYLLNVK